MVSGQQIKEAREALGLTRTGLASRAGLHHSSVRWAEENKGDPRSRAAILKALGLSESADSNGTVREVNPSDFKGDVIAESSSLSFGKFISPGASGASSTPSPEDVVLPAGLVRVAREESLTMGQTLNLVRVKSVLNDNGGNCNPRTVEEWRSFCQAMKVWL